MPNQRNEMLSKPNYDQEFNLLKPHLDLIEIARSDAKVLIAPQLQGRVLTSCTYSENEGYGWINHNLIQSKKSQAHINTFGGEDRIWIGPEAGQFALFFKPGDDFSFDNWQTPACIDSEPFEVVWSKPSAVLMRKKCGLKNYQNFDFEVEIERQITIEDPVLMNQKLGNTPVDHVTYSSANWLTNSSNKPWSKSTGLMNIWILGKFKPAPNCWAIIPEQDDAPINQNYFYANLKNRLFNQDGVVALQVDGTLKSKIGIAPQHDKNVLGSFDFDLNRLTTITYETDKSEVFLNSEWEIQDQPYQGDVLNVYNDGPNPDGSILGPYYELETSSSSKELSPQESIYHKHTTSHFEGSFHDLNQVAQTLLHTDLNDVKKMIDAK